MIIYALDAASVKSFCRRRSLCRTRGARVKHVPESEEEKNHILQISEDCPAEAIEVILSENADGGS